MKPYIIITLICSLAFMSCASMDLCEPTSPQSESRYSDVTSLFAGEQTIGEDKWIEAWNCSFQMWIWLYPDATCIVRSGFPYYIEGRYVDERLSYRMESDRIAISDPLTGNVLYSGTVREGLMHLSWSHSSGPLWDKYAPLLGWVPELDLYEQQLSD